MSNRPTYPPRAFEQAFAKRLDDPTWPSQVNWSQGSRCSQCASGRTYSVYLAGCYGDTERGRICLTCGNRDWAARTEVIAALLDRVRRESEGLQGALDAARSDNCAKPDTRDACEIGSMAGQENKDVCDRPER